MEGHLWTVLPRLRRARPLLGERWRGGVEDPERGLVALSGWLRTPPGARDVVLLVHGLGGSSDSPYLTAVALACEARGIATLRLDLRGSDDEGTDFYHAGLTADVAAAIASRELARFSRVLLLGFSLGGHVVLRHATEEHDPRLRAVAAVCSPLELRPAQQAIDRPAAWPYRRYILGRLRRLYAGIATRAAVPTPVSRVLRARTLREWDSLTVVPRFGFRDADDYYARASVGARLGGLDVPALVVASRADPMVPVSAIEPAASATPTLDLRWVRGGHVGFPAALHLGLEAPPGLGPQLAAWLAGVAGRPPHGALA